MEPPEDITRNMYLPMEALNSDILSQLGNIRLLMVPKKSCDDIGGYRNLLGDESDWMMAEKNKPRSPPVSPAVPWSRNTFDFKAPEKDLPVSIQYRQDNLQESTKETSFTPRQFLQERLTGRSSDKPCNRTEDNFNHSPHLYREVECHNRERIQTAKRQLFCTNNEETQGNGSNSIYHESDRMSQLLSFIESTSSSNIPTSPVLRTAQIPNNQQPNFSNHHSPCSCSHTPGKPSIDKDQHLSKRRKLDTTSTPEKKENIPRKTANCTCTMMEEHFLQMAETAYKNIRRKDTSPASFEQFKRELTQTNDILKESVDIVNTIKEMCEHWKITTK